MKVITSFGVKEGGCNVWFWFFVLFILIPFLVGLGVALIRFVEFFL